MRHATMMTTANTNPMNSTKDQNSSQEENKAPMTQDPEQLFNTGPYTGGARVTTRDKVRDFFAQPLAVGRWYNDNDGPLSRRGPKN